MKLILNDDNESIAINLEKRLVDSVSLTRVSFLGSSTFHFTREELDIFIAALQVVRGSR